MKGTNPRVEQADPIPPPSTDKTYFDGDDAASEGDDVAQRVVGLDEERQRVRGVADDELRHEERYRERQRQVQPRGTQLQHPALHRHLVCNDSRSHQPASRGPRPCAANGIIARAAPSCTVADQNCAAWSRPKRAVFSIKVSVKLKA